MIYSLKGKITAKENNLAVIECGGVGYACRTTLNTLSALECDGKDVLLYTFMIDFQTKKIDLFVNL